MAASCSGVGLVGIVSLTAEYLPLQQFVILVLLAWLNRVNGREFAHFLITRVKTVDGLHIGVA